ILTNSLVPCNGRFPTIIALLTLFCSISLGGIIGSFWTAIELTAIIFLCVCITLGCSYLLSKTVLKGNPSFYTLELPSFRVPKIGQVIVRSVFDRTLFVLGRSLLVAAPAGLVLWLLANIPLKDTSLLSQLAYYLNEVGQWFGLDGTILLAFLLGIPANEIIIPIMLMVYTGGTALTEYESLAHLKDILITNGWTLETALCVLFLMLFHSPCSTTLITIYKETKNKVYTLLAFLIPTIIGILGCLGIHLLFQLF
ncbi:MAG: ferrous iron transporter B, partial [Clostridia bacterium]|nr:ferrous iron transporter B [Clostridia bacterium]